MQWEEFQCEITGCAVWCKAPSMSMSPCIVICNKISNFVQHLRQIHTWTPHFTVLTLGFYHTCHDVFSIELFKNTWHHIWKLLHVYLFNDAFYRSKAYVTQRWMWGGLWMTSSRVEGGGAAVTSVRRHQSIYVGWMRITHVQTRHFISGLWTDSHEKPHKYEGFVSRYSRFWRSSVTSPTNFFGLWMGSRYTPHLSPSFYHSDISRWNAVVPAGFVTISVAACSVVCRIAVPGFAWPD